MIQIRPRAFLFLYAPPLTDADSLIFVESRMWQSVAELPPGRLGGRFFGATIPRICLHYQYKTQQSIDTQEMRYLIWEVKGKVCFIFAQKGQAVNMSRFFGHELFLVLLGRADRGGREFRKRSFLAFLIS